MPSGPSSSATTDLAAAAPWSYRCNSTSRSSVPLRYWSSRLARAQKSRMWVCGVREQNDVAKDAAQPPEVLALQVAAVAVAVHLGRDEVAARPDEPGDVELGRRPAVLAVADALAVHPEVERRRHPREVDEDLAPLPRGRKVECSTVGADRVVVGRYVGRVGFERVALVDVEGLPVALPLHRSGHRDVAPRCIVEIGTEERERPVGRPRRPLELPSAVQRQDVRRLFRAKPEGLVARREGHEGGVRPLGVDARDARVLPVVGGDALAVVVRDRRRHEAEESNDQRGENGGLHEPAHEVHAPHGRLSKGRRGPGRREGRL